MKKVFLPAKTAAALAMLAALSIICGKYLAFGIGNVMRFSLENLPILFGGIAFGPVAGALVGAVADLVGCLLVGYEINPIVTAGAVAIGALSGIFSHLFKKAKLPPALYLTASIAIAHLVGSVVIKTYGLATFYDMPFYLLMLWRLLNYAIVGTVECILIYILMKNRAISSAIASIKRKKG